MSSEYEFTDNVVAVRSKLAHLAKAAVTGALDGLQTQAKINAPGDTGALKRSINTMITGDDDGASGMLGSYLDYAVYVEFGTGEHATNGKGRVGYWVYVDGASHDKSKENESPKQTYTLEEAKQVKAILIAKGVKPGDVHVTNGIKAKKFLTNTYRDKKQAVMEYIANVFKEV